MAVKIRQKIYRCDDANTPSNTKVTEMKWRDIKHTSNVSVRLNSSKSHVSLKDYENEVIIAGSVFHNMIQTLLSECDAHYRAFLIKYIEGLQQQKKDPVWYKDDATYYSTYRWFEKKDEHGNTMTHDMMETM